MGCISMSLAGVVGRAVAVCSDCIESSPHILTAHTTAKDAGKDMNRFFSDRHSGGIQFDRLSGISVISFQNKLDALKPFSVFYDWLMVVFVDNPFGFILQTIAAVCFSGIVLIVSDIKYI